MNIKKQPSKISATQWGKTVTIEIDYSDTDLYEFVEMFKGVVVGLEYDESSWRTVIKELGELYKEEDGDEDGEFHNSVNNEFYHHPYKLSEKEIDEALAEHNRDEEDIENELQ